MEISIIVGQFPISFNIEENLNNIVNILDKSEMDDLVVLSEGALSGYSDDNEEFTYKKVNLATHERGVFQAGNKLTVHKLKFKNGEVNIGVQLCREIHFPEQWRCLALNGADIFVYLTNAVGGGGLSVWRSQLISRAAENQRFLISSNNANMNQHCPTMLIAPDGEVIEEVVSDKLTSFKSKINLEEVSNWYINQMRNDVIWVAEGNK